jgi:hypothetical protein
MSLDVPKIRVPSNPSDTNADQFIDSVTVDIANMSLDPPLAEFTLFPKLPIELRLKTFGYALPDGGRTAIRARLVLKGDRGSFKKAASVRSPQDQWQGYSQYAIIIAPARTSGCMQGVSGDLHPVIQERASITERLDSIP